MTATTQHAPQCNVRDVDDTSWLLSSGMLVLSMQAGFALLEAGVVRNIHAANIMMKNLLDLCIAAISWWALGWGLAYGADWGGCIGTSQFFGKDVRDVSQFFFQFTFCATVSTIDSGAVAERMRFVPYIGLSTWMTTITYPILVHWAWYVSPGPGHGSGFLNDLGYIDLAGSGVVHLAGGVSGLVASWWLGPRAGRFAPRVKIDASSPTKTGARKKAGGAAEAGGDATACAPAPAPARGGRPKMNRMSTVRSLLFRDGSIPNTAKVAAVRDDDDEADADVDADADVPEMAESAVRGSAGGTGVANPAGAADGRDTPHELLHVAEQIDPVQRRVSAWQADLEKQRKKLKQARESKHDKRSERYVVTRGIGMPSFPAGDPVSQLFGCFLLWLGWYGFNCGSTLGLGNGLHAVASSVAICTTLAAAAGGITGAFISTHYVGVATVESTACGILSGLVAITAGPHVVLPGESIVIGIIASCVCFVSRQAFIRWRVDDPVEAISIHGSSAIWGVLAVGLFADDGTPCGVSGLADKGLFHGGSARLLGVQALGILCIGAWAAANAAAAMWLMQRCGVRLRATQSELALGLDIVEHGVESTAGLAQKLAYVHTLLSTMPTRDRRAMQRAMEALVRVDDGDRE